MTWIQKKKRQKSWRVGWRDGGRASPKKYSSWYDDEDTAIAFRRVLDERIAVKKEQGNLVILPWNTVRAKWLATLTGRYEQEARAALIRYADDWTSTLDATPAVMSTLPIGTSRIVKSCLNWARRILKQPLDREALEVPPIRKRPRKAERPLLDDAEVDALIAKAMAWSPGNGAICHLVSWYGHRAASLVELHGSALDERGELTLRAKNGMIGSHPLLPQSVTILRALGRKADQPLFLNHLGKQWKHGKEFADWFAQSFSIGYYDALKRSSVTNWFAAGVDAKTIASITMHETPSLLHDRYARTNRSRQLHALELLAKYKARKPAKTKLRLVKKPALEAQRGTVHQ